MTGAGPDALADPAPLDLFATQRFGSLITLERDGRPQASVVGHAFDRARPTIHVSLTDGRAKTRNLRRDQRAGHMVIRADGWAYAVGEGDEVLTPVATDPHDATVEELVALCRDLAGEHPDRDEYRAAMVADRRLVLTLGFGRVYGAVIRS